MKTQTSKANQDFYFKDVKFVLKKRYKFFLNL